MAGNSNKVKGSAEQSSSQDEGLELVVMSFGYKEGAPPPANMVFDVRFLKNPYWEEELRPLTGKDLVVQDFVLGQPLAQDFFNSVCELLDLVLPHFKQLNLNELTIAFGCTGGQHRSVTMAEVCARHVAESFPGYGIKLVHRELDHLDVGVLRHLLGSDGVTSKPGDRKEFI